MGWHIWSRWSVVWQTGVAGKQAGGWVLKSLGWYCVHGRISQQHFELSHVMIGGLSGASVGQFVIVEQKMMDKHQDSLDVWWCSTLKIQKCPFNLIKCNNILQNYMKQKYTIKKAAHTRHCKALLGYLRRFNHLLRFFTRTEILGLFVCYWLKHIEFVVRFYDQLLQKQCNSTGLIYFLLLLWLICHDTFYHSLHPRLHYSNYSNTVCVCFFQTRRT